MHKTVGIESHIAKPFIAYNRKRLALHESACEMKIMQALPTQLLPHNIKGAQQSYFEYIIVGSVPVF